MKYNLGDRVTSVAIEEFGVVGIIADLDFDRVRIRWYDGTHSYENYEDLILVARRNDDLKYLRKRQPPAVHREDVPPGYEELLDFYAEGVPFSTRESGSPDLSGLLVDDRAERGIQNPAMLNAYYNLKEERETQQIATSLLNQSLDNTPYETSTDAYELSQQFAHRKIGTGEVYRDWEPGDIVSVSRPGRNAGHLAVAHIFRVRPASADIIWVDPVSHKEIETTESLETLIFIRHDPAWRAKKEAQGLRLESEDVFNAGFIALNPQDLGYGAVDYGYPTRLIPDPMAYETYFKENITRDYLGNQIRKHSVGDNRLEDYELLELQYGGVTRGYQPFRGFERFADYLWR